MKTTRPLFLRETFKIFIFYILYLLLVIILTFVVLEIIFRILPTAELIKLEKLNNSQIVSFEKNKEFNYSLGYNFYQVVKKNSNNYGFLSDISYEKNSKPFAVIIGDSYVEAIQVENKNSIGNLLGNYLNSNVYSFGINNSALSQYVAFTEFVENEFNPSTYIFLIVGNDIDESYCLIKQQPGRYCYDKNLNLQYNDYEGYSSLMNILRSSALVRYLVLNARIDWRYFANLLNILESEVAYKNYSTYIDSEPSSQIENISYELINKFIFDIKKIVKGKDVILVLDYDRGSIYKGNYHSSVATKTKYFKKMRDFISKQALKNQFILLDMKSVFIDDYKLNGEIFEFQSDGHWNERAHKLAAEQLFNILN